MSARRVLTGSVIALLMPASLLMATQVGSAGDDTTDATDTSSNARTTTERAKQRASLVAMPQIAQQGKGVANADAAKAALTATIKPVKIGRPVKLQVRKGSAWKTVSKRKQDAKGRAEFTAAAASGGEGLSYRVMALPFKGLPTIKSGVESTERWLGASFTDEFTGTSLDPIWSHRGQSYEPSSLRACTKGDPRAVNVSGGTVRLSVMKDPNRSSKCVAKKDGKSTGKFAYRIQGHIGTQSSYSFKYGFAAARIKMHKSRGQHGGFWMLPDPSVAGTGPMDGAEIDAIEYFGDKHPQGGLTSFTYHYNGRKQIKTGDWIKNPTSFLKNRRDGWSKSFHVFSVEWTPSAYIFRIDGRETWRSTKGVSHVPEFPILSLLSSDYEISQIGSDRKLPQTMQVDWLRVWER
jgi:beta-glucanase (GH16 family)